MRGSRERISGQLVTKNQCVKGKQHGSTSERQVTYPNSERQSAQRVTISEQQVTYHGREGGVVAADAWGPGPVLGELQEGGWRWWKVRQPRGEADGGGGEGEQTGERRRGSGGPGPREERPTGRFVTARH